MQRLFAVYVEVNTDKLNDGLFPAVNTVAYKGTPEFESLSSTYDYLLVDVWATWCGPCIAQHPDVNKLAEQYKNTRVGIVAFAIQSERKDWDSYMGQGKITYPSYFLDGKNGGAFAKQAKVGSIPRYMLMRTKDGVLLEKNISFTDLESVLKKYL